MTRAEIRIAAAKRRLAEAEARLAKAYAWKRKQEDNLARKVKPVVARASRSREDARAALAIAELAALGIEPMRTIVLWHPGGRGITGHGRWAVRVTLSGLVRMVPVGKSGRVLKSRNEQIAPWNWSRVTVTDEVVRDADQG